MNPSLILDGLFCLIVEPDSSSAHLLAIKLKNAGVKSTHVYNCTFALEILKNLDKKFDLVLVNATKGNVGFSIFPDQMRLKMEGRTVPPVMSYLYTKDSDQILSLFKMGYKHCFTRPIDPIALWKKIESVVSQKPPEN